MEENQSAQSRPEQEVAQSINGTPDRHNRKSKSKRYAIGVVCAVLISLLGAVSYLYLDQKKQNDELKSEAVSLRERIGDSADSGEIEPETLDIEEEATVTAAEEGCREGSSYTADIGKFIATLENPYVIIRNLDAGFEGGPVTSLNIAACLDGEVNVYDSSPTQEVNILAHPASSSAELRESYEATAGTLTSTGTITIDGVTADRYTLSGLFETSLYYFDNEGIGYQIELSDTNEITSAILLDLTDDWTFTL